MNAIERAARIDTTTPVVDRYCEAGVPRYKYGPVRPCGEPAKAWAPASSFTTTQAPLCGRHLGLIKAAATREAKARAKAEAERAHLDAMSEWSSTNEAATRPLVERLLELLDVEPKDVFSVQGRSGRYTGEITLNVKAADRIVDQLEQLLSYENDIDRNERLAEGGY